MAIQSKNARQVPSGRNSSSGAAVLDRPAIHSSRVKDDDRLQQEIARLVQASQEGRLDERGEPQDFNVNDRRIIEGVNSILEASAEKVNWFERVLDAVQFPIHVIDKDMKWVFLNKAFEKLMVDNGTIRSRKDAPGMPCSSAKASICKTENCGLVQLAKGNGETYFDWGAQKCKQESSKLVNTKGEHIGFVEVVQDLTSLIAVKEYTAKEVVRVASSLAKIAKGDLDVSISLADADKFTGDARGSVRPD